MKLSDFCYLVDQVVTGLPAQFRQYLDNVVVDVEPRPSSRTLRQVGLAPGDWHELMGLFEGKSMPDQEYGEQHPNRVVLFQESIEAACSSFEQVRYEVRRTILHELAHHFGFSEEDLEEFESMPSPFDQETPEGSR